MKTCSKCALEKPLDKFGPQKENRDGLRSYCKDCTNAYQRQWRIDKPEVCRAISRRATLKRCYGLTVDQYDAMLVAQDGKCAICGSADPQDSRANMPFHIDHCHKTGQIRALLCSMCNKGIGCLRDDPELVRKAAAYLDSWLGSYA